MSKVKKAMATIICAIAIMCCTTQATTVSAATANMPYSYNWVDDSNGNKHIQFYEFDKNLNSYRITRRVMMKNKKNVYSNSGALLYSVKEAGYSSSGDLYVILSTGNVEKLTYASKKVSYKVNAVKLNFDAEDLVTSILVTGKGNVKLSDLANINPTPTPSPSPSPTPANPTPTPVNPSPTPTPSKAKNRVERTDSNGNQIVRAYKDNKKKLQLYISGSKILNETNGVRLSDTVKGAKFLGIDTRYNVYLSEINGKLYKFKFGNWYSAEVVNIDGDVKSVINNNNGFITAIKTDKGTEYKISELNKRGAWVAKKTYAVNKEVTLPFTRRAVVHQKPLR